MIRIIIHGCYGKMGQTLAALAAASPDIEVAAGVDPGSPTGKTPFPVFPDLAACSVPAEVIVDFSSSKALPKLLETAALRYPAVVIATTGHTPEDKELIRSRSREIAILYSANMSLGINLLKELIQQAATVLGEGFDIEIVEKHHNQKKDSPSGTALLLADALNEVFLNSRQYVYGRHTRTDLRQPAEIGIHAVRAGTIVGEHEVLFAGKDEVVELRHAAYSRQIFANGALKAARFLVGKPPGLYGMKDMITASSAVTRLYVGRQDALITVYRVPCDTSRIASVFRGIAAENISVDMISQTAPVDGQVEISFTLPRKEVGKAERLLASFQTEVARDIVKLAVEGPGMETQSGVAARFFEVMAAAGVAIRSVTTSETKIACIIDSPAEARAVEAVKKAFGI